MDADRNTSLNHSTVISAGLCGIAERDTLFILADRTRDINGNSDEYFSVPFKEVVGAPTRARAGGASAPC